MWVPSNPPQGQPREEAFLRGGGWDPEDPLIPELHYRKGPYLGPLEMTPKQALPSVPKTSSQREKKAHYSLELSATLLAHPVHRALGNYNCTNQSSTHLKKKHNLIAP